MKKPVSELVARIEGWDDNTFEVEEITKNPNGTYSVLVTVIKEEVDG